MNGGFSGGTGQTVTGAGGFVPRPKKVVEVVEPVAPVEAATAPTEEGAEHAEPQAAG